MILKNILKDSNVNILGDFQNFEVKFLTDDSRKATADSMFFAVKGYKVNGARFIEDAIKNGAKVIVCQDDIYQNTSGKVCFIKVVDVKKTLLDSVDNFYKDTKKKIKIIGITGTNGKTTTSYLIKHILEEFSFNCGLIGTITHLIKDKKIESINTTPSLLENYNLIQQMVDDGCNYCIMEVSSHGLDQGRVTSIDFEGAIFSNLTQDHLDYHITMDEYFNAKLKLFESMDLNKPSIINIDDQYGSKIISKILGKKVFTYGIVNKADFKAENIKYDVCSTTFDLIYPDGKISIISNLIGEFNVYNILASAVCAYSLGLDMHLVADYIREFKGVCGRLEKVENDKNKNIIIDYAHTPDALEKILKTLKSITKSRIILVFGCGGDRDKKKRPLMGKIASQLADYSVVTSDNPRSEAPEEIINQVVEGFTKSNYCLEINRVAAIKRALDISDLEDSVVLIAGKGHEKYQIIGDQKIEFDEVKLVKTLLNVKN